MQPKRAELSEEVLDLIATRFRVLGEPMRLRILHALGEDELSVGELVERTGGSQANVSKHLSLLQESGLLSRRKEGLSVFYRVADRTIFELCETVCASLSERFTAHQQALRKFALR